MKPTNQQQSPDEGNVQRLERKLVPLIGETENTCKGEDIVQDRRGSKSSKPAEYFLRLANKKYGKKFTYDLSNYNGLTKNKIKITCPVHGAFEQVPHTFLLKNCVTGCAKCGFERRNKTKTRSYSNFILKAKTIHNDRYTYPRDNESAYKNRKSKIAIICPVHGKFTKSAQKHLSGQGCRKCNLKRLIADSVIVGGYNLGLFDKRPELKAIPAKLYYLRINDGEYYKIGITVKPVNDRIKGIKSKSKRLVHNVDVVWVIEASLYKCYLKEQELLTRYASVRCFTDWSNELFSENVLPLKLSSIS